jgi:dimethylsulfoniopropionate demethylase
MTPRNIAKAKIGQCFYLPLCDEKGKLLNDPVGLKLAEDHWWLSLADSDILLWAKGLATGFGFDVHIEEPDVSPLAIQGPKAEDLVAKVMGETVRDIRFFRFKRISYKGHPLVVARSGWSKQGGFEIYVDDPTIAVDLWDEFFVQGESMNVRAGCPNGIERLESGLMSFGNDMDYDDTPFDCGLDRYVSLKSNINSLSIEALREYAKAPQKQLIGLVIDQNMGALNPDILINGEVIGEVRSQSWSPRYQRTLAFAMCYRSAISGLRDIHLETADQSVSAQISVLPFDFEALGLA